MEGFIMKRSRFGNKITLGALTMLIACATTAFAAVEPTPDPSYRPLRSDSVKTWYVYVDSNNNGILDPSDMKVAAMDNMWTAVGSDTALGVNGTDAASCASPNNGSADPYVIPQQQDRLSIYMNYSQESNNFVSDWPATTEGQYQAEKYGRQNGWSMNYVANTGVLNGNTYEAGNVTPRGELNMDIYVHNGAGVTTADFGGTPGLSLSDPQVGMTTGLGEAARDPGTGQLAVVSYNELTQSYNQEVNQAMKAWFEENGGTLNVEQIASQMNLREFDPYNPSTWTVDNREGAIFAGLTPDQIMCDPAIRDLLMEWGQAVSYYNYQDVFTHRGEYGEETAEGGVIAGLIADSDGEDLDWAEQTVVRIDLDLDPADTTIDEVALYDFGYAAGASQVNPVEIVFGVNEAGEMFLDADGDGEYDGYADLNGNGQWDEGEGDLMLDNNRLFIAENAEVPEPGTLALLAAGGAAMYWKRRKARKSA